MKKIKLLLCLLLLCLSVFSVNIFASIYNEDTYIIDKNISGERSDKSGSVAANVTTMSSKIPSLTISKGVELKANTTDVSGTILNSVNGILTVMDNAKFLLNTAYESGGAIYNLNLTSVTVIGNNVKFSSNVATNAGGAIYSIGNLKIGDNVEFYGNKFTSASVNGISVDGSKVLTGGAIFQNGGSVDTEKQKWLSIGKDARFFNNSAYKGGAMYVILSSVTIGSNANFTNNSANYRGGAVYVFRSTFTIEDGVTFSSNTAENKGGAIYAFDSVLNFNADKNVVLFTDNKSADGSGGGGIYSVNGEINLDAKNNNITFEKNSSIKSTGTTVMNIETLNSKYVFFDADVDMKGGTINFNSGEIKVGSNCSTFNVGTLNLSSGTFGLSAGTISNLKKVQTVEVDTFTSTENVNLSIDITVNSDTQTVNDKFTVGKSASGIINLNEINISSISSNYGDITLFSGSNLENLRIKISANPTYSGNKYAFFQSPTLGTLDFSTISTITSNFLNSETTNASTFSSNSLINSGTVTNHLAIYGNSNNSQLSITGNSITIDSVGALSLFDLKFATNNATNTVKNNNYFYAENVKFLDANIINSCAVVMDSGTVVESSSSADTVRFIAYDSSFEKVSIKNNLNVTVNNTEKAESKNFVVNLKLSSVTFSKITDDSVIKSEMSIKITSVTDTNINNKIICSIDSATFQFNKTKDTGSGGVIYNGYDTTTDISIDSNTSKNIVINSNVEYKIGANVIFSSNSAGIGGVIYSNNKLKDDTINTFLGVKNSSFTSKFLYSIGSNVVFSSNSANLNGGAIYNYVEKSSASVVFNTEISISSNVAFTSNTAILGFGGAIYNKNGTILFNDGVSFSSNSANKGGAIYNEEGTINLTAKEYDVIFNGNDETGGAIYDSSGTINLAVYNGRKIVFQTNSDTIVSKDTTSVLNINKDIDSQNEAIIEINSDMSGFKGTTNIYSGFFKFGTLGNLFGGNTIVENAVFDFTSDNGSVKNYNLNNFQINNQLGLLVDVDLAEMKMDTISSDSNSSGSGSIYVKEFNLISTTSNKSVEILFTSSTALKGKVSSSGTASSDEYLYDVDYDKNTGYFTFTNRFVANPVTLEGSVSLLAGAMATQENVLNQAFASMNTSLTNRHDRRLDIVKDSKNLYASTENFIFFSKSKIEGGFWLRPYAYKENLTLASYDIESTIYGALAGLDLKLTDTKLLSFYIGYTGVNQTFENIKVDENGYVFGATGMFVKENFYAGVTANAGVSDTTAKSAMGSNDFQINTYTIGLKGGYEFDLNKVFIFEPNISLMYGYMEAEKYVTEQGAKISKEGFNNFRIEPQLKFNFNLDDGWKPYALLGYIVNTGKTNAVVNGNKKQAQKLDPYCEYGAGLEKNFIGTAWVGFAQITGKTGGKKGVGINLGIKYAF